MPHSSSSSSAFDFVPVVRAAPPPAAALSSPTAAQGNARFMHAMSVPPCILVGPTPEQPRPRKTEVDSHPSSRARHVAAAAAAMRDGEGCGQATPRLRRVYSSSSSSYSYSAATTCATKASTTPHVESVVGRKGSTDATPSAKPNTAGKPTLPGSRATLSAEAFQQVLQELQHPRVRAGRRAADGVSGGAGDVRVSAAVPSWWSVESSILPAGSSLPTSSSSTSCSTFADVATAMQPLRTMKTMRAGAHVLSPLSPSSCGCPTSCSCRTDDGCSSVGSEVEHDGHRHRTHQTRTSHMKRRAVRRVCAVRSDDSVNSSVTGATPVDTSQSSDDGAYTAASTYCSCSAHHDSCISGSDSSLCSACAADGVRSHRLLPPYPHTSRSDRGGGGDANFAQRDVFSEAVRGETMWEEVPPLLHLSSPPPGGRGRDEKGDGGRERAALRVAYIAQAALLASGRREAEAAPQVAPVAESASPRCTAETQTELDDEARQKRRAEESERQRQWEVVRAEERLRGIAAAQCAEVALPLLHRELADHETRTTTQQQQLMEMVVQQLREYQREVQTLQTTRVAELAAHRAQWEKDQQQLREEGEARVRAGRRDCGTLPEPSPAPVVDPIPMEVAVVRYTAGTQHSDGTLERLAVVESDAQAWLLRALVSLEEDARGMLTSEERASRALLVGVVEEASRRVLLRCQAEILHWRRVAMIERQAATCAADLRLLEMQEAMARQELSTAASGELRDALQCCQAKRTSLEAAAVQSTLRQTQQELRTAEDALTALQAEQQDTLEHTRHLRVQLLHALRLPTITLPENSLAPVCGPAPGAPLLSAAYAYATATDDGAEGAGSGAATAARGLVPVEDVPVHRRFARAHQEALRVVRAQCRTV